MPTHVLRRRLGAAAATAALLAGCSSPEPKTLVVGLPADHPGLALTVAGEHVGFESAIARYLARDLGSEGRDEVGLATMSARERAAKVRTHHVSFVLGTDTTLGSAPDEVRQVGPYLVSGLRLAVRAGSTTTRDALAGHRVCTAFGSSAQDRMPALLPGAVAASEPTISTCLTNVAQGRADAALDDGLVLAGYAALPAYGGITVAPGELTHDEHMILVAADRPQLCRTITASLRTMVKDGAWATAARGDLVGPGITATPPAAPTVRGCD